MKHFLHYDFDKDLIANIQDYYAEMFAYISTIHTAFDNDTLINRTDILNYLEYMVSPEPEKYCNELVIFISSNELLNQLKISKEDFRYIEYDSNFPENELVNHIILQLKDLVEHPEHLPYLINDLDFYPAQINALMENFDFNLIYHSDDKNYKIRPSKECYEKIINDIIFENFGK